MLEFGAGERRHLDPTSRLAAWIASRYDFVPESASACGVSTARPSGAASPNLQTQDLSCSGGGYTAMKLDRQPFKDVRVRRALTLASSWKEILETNACSQGHGTPNVTIPAALRERTTTSVAPPSPAIRWPPSRCTARLTRLAGSPGWNGCSQSWSRDCARSC